MDRSPSTRCSAWVRTPPRPRSRPHGDDALIRFAASLVCGAGPGALNTADAHRIVSTAGIDPASVTEQTHQHLTAAASGGAAGMLPTLPMLLGHLLAALAAGWLLRRGEIALFRLARLSLQGAQQVAAGARLRALRAALVLVAALRAGLPGGPKTGPRIPRTAVDAPSPVTGDPLQHMVIRRGPPPYSPSQPDATPFTQERKRCRDPVAHPRAGAPFLRAYVE